MRSQQPPGTAAGITLCHAGMNGFLSSMFAEMGARRRRLREMLGDRGQGFAEFLVLGGVLAGALGLLIGPWMPAAAPWGFAIPFVFVAGFVLIEARRQGQLRQGADAETLASGYDWAVFLWSFGCALAGAAAFVIALAAKPPPSDENWTPPQSTVSVDISP